VLGIGSAAKIDECRFSAGTSKQVDKSRVFLSIAIFASWRVKGLLAERGVEMLRGGQRRSVFPCVAAEVDVVRQILENQPAV